MKRFLLAALALCAMGSAAQAHFVDGYAAECVSLTTTTCTEPTYTNYGRQPMFFNAPATGGAMVSGQAFTFGSASVGTYAGRGVYDAPTGGHLLFIIPAVSLTTASNGDYGDVGAIKMTLANVTGIYGETISAIYRAGATLGTAADGSTVTAGANITIGRGILQWFAAPADPFYVQTTQVSGFTYTAPGGVGDVQINGAGTLAAGTLALTAVPSDGQILRLFCGVTITALTVTNPAGYTMVGNPPTTCGPNASHEWLFFAATHVVVNLF